MHRPVLLVLHQEHSTPGRVGHELRARGVSLDIRRPRFGDPLPKTLNDHTGAIVFGGPMSANDSDEYIAQETDWIAVPLAEKKPFLGICLGAQMLARHLKAGVDLHKGEAVEVGYYPIQPTKAGLEACEKWPSHVYQWHREGFDLPSGATLLAKGDAFPHQAFRYGPAAFGLQFHPEVTHAMMCVWTTRGHARMSLPGAKSRTEHFRDRAVYDFAIRTWLSGFLDQWLTLDQPQQRESVSAVAAE